MIEPLDTLYREVLLEHMRTPYGQTHLEQPFQSAQLYNASCGDVAIVEVSEHGNTLACAAFVEGCALCKASGSILCQLITGSDQNQAQRYIAAIQKLVVAGQSDQIISGTDLEAFVGVTQYPSRVKCVLLPWSAFSKAIATSKIETNHAQR